MAGFGHKKINVGVSIGGRPHCRPRPPPIHVHVTPSIPVTTIYPSVPTAPAEVPASTQESYAWIPTSTHHCDHLLHKAVQAGHEGHDGSPIYVGRAHYQGDLIPCKVIPRHRVAYLAYNGREIGIQNVELYCRQTAQIEWVPSSHGSVPQGAVPAGHTKEGEALFLGRAHHAGSLTPGKVHGSHRCCYISFGGNEIAKQSYEVMVLRYY